MIIFGVISIIFAIAMHFKVGVPFSIFYFFQPKEYRKEMSDSEKSICYTNARNSFICVGLSILIVQLLISTQLLSTSDMFLYIIMILLVSASVIANIAIDLKKFTH